MDWHWAVVCVVTIRDADAGSPAEVTVPHLDWLHGHNSRCTSWKHHYTFCTSHTVSLLLLPRLRVSLWWLSQWWSLLTSCLLVHYLVAVVICMWSHRLMDTLNTKCRTLNYWQNNYNLINTFFRWQRTFILQAVIPYTKNGLGHTKLNHIYNIYIMMKESNVSLTICLTEIIVWRGDAVAQQPSTAVIHYTICKIIIDSSGNCTWLARSPIVITSKHPITFLPLKYALLISIRQTNPEQLSCSIVKFPPIKIRSIS